MLIDTDDNLKTKIREHTRVLLTTYERMPYTTFLYWLNKRIGVPEEKQALIGIPSNVWNPKYIHCDRHANCIQLMRPLRKHARFVSTKLSLADYASITNSMFEGMTKREKLVHILLYAGVLTTANYRPAEALQALKRPDIPALTYLNFKALKTVARYHPARNSMPFYAPRLLKDLLWHDFPYNPYWRKKNPEAAHKQFPVTTEAD